MKTLRSRVTGLVAGVLIVISFRQSAANEAVRSKVTAVTVYSDRAMITRSADVSLAAGTNIVEFGALPVSFVDQSLRVSGSAESGVKILDVRIKTVYIDTIPDTRIKNLQDRLYSLRGREQFLVKKLEVMRTQLAFIDSLRIYYARTASAGNSGTSYQEWQRALVFVEKNMDSVNTRSLEAGAQLQDTRNKISATEDEIRRTQSYARKIEKHVIVTLSAEKAGSSAMQMSYVLGGARWSPVYETRLNSDAKNLEVVYSGMVSQATGEDWKGVAVTLSTAQPSAGGAPPILSPWEVGAYNTIARSGALMKAAVADEAATRNAMVVTAVPDEQSVSMTLPDAQLMEGMTAATFLIKTPADIPGDNSPHKVTITTASLPAELSYSCVPKLSPGAFLTAKATNTTDYPFLPGTMNVFLDNSFVATSSMPMVSPAGEFSAYMGTDAAVKVERKLVKQFTESTGLLSKKTRTTFDFLISLENGKKVPVDIDVKDQVPVSKDERIVVEVLVPEPAEVKPDDHGILDWKLSLKPREKKELRVKFSVEYPSDLPVSGIR